MFTYIVNVHDIIRKKKKNKYHTVDISVYILGKSLPIYVFFAKKQSVNDVDKLDDFSEQWAGFASIVIMGEQGK